MIPGARGRAGSLVSAEAAAEEFVCGDDPDEHVRMLKSYIDAGYDEVFISQIGPEQRGFFDFYAQHVLPLVNAPITFTSSTV